MKRRRFLKVAGYGLSAAALGAGGFIDYIQPRRHRLAPGSPDDASRPSSAASRKRVVVVGGGVAGLVAATELAARNFDVTLVERAPELGGKLGGWTVDAFGERFPMEHGFHGFFSQYYNLGEVLAAAGATSDLVESPGYPVLFGDRPSETFGRTSKLFPLNLIQVIRQSRSLRFMDFRDDGHGLYDLMKFDGEPTFDRFDGVDFAAFCREGKINRGIVETVFEPFGKTTLNRVDRLSAAEAIRFFHFYFMGNPEGLAFRFTRRDSMTAVVGPLRRRLEALGGRVKTGVMVSRLVRGAEGLRAVELAGAPNLADGAVSFRLTEVPSAGFLEVPRGDGSAVFVARRSDELVAIDGRCTHMGCPVALDLATGGFLCPCHGGRFDGDGKVAAGPPQRPLVRLRVDATGTSGHDARDGSEVVFAREEAGRASGSDELPCDYCVVACDVRGLKRLVGDSAPARAGDRGLAAPELERRVAQLGEADPYVVWRLWLDRPTAPERSPFYTTSRLRYTDSVAIYSAFQEPYISWATRTRGSVIEVHAYAIRPEAMAPAEVIQRAMLGELFQLLPELAGARVLHAEYQQQDNFSRFAPGDHATRPTTETPVANLFLAGDHVRLPVPAALMEAATISGRLAANAILRHEGVREVAISTVAPRGPLLL